MPHSQVDEQVVKMSFDNSNFDGNINDSIKALNSLDARLFSLNKENFAGLTNSVNNLANVFTVKGQIMLGVLTRIGSEAVNIGKKVFNKLTSGIRGGMQEYKTLIDATQTIYENVKQDGKTIEDVNNALDELNYYADKTIYNFTEMTRMIGMFTSAGVGLGSSVKTIKGLANAAALVGANVQKAEMAWRAVSRAMSTGKFTALTWKTLEQSNIAGKQFQEVIKTVARAHKVVDKHGRDIDKMTKKYGSLRESLKEGWLTNDLFTEAMSIMSGDMSRAELKQKKYTDKQIDQLMEIAHSAEEAATRVKTFRQLLETTAEAIGSGWTESFRILIGDLEQARELYTRISNVISDFIENNAKIRKQIFDKIMNNKDKGISNSWLTGRDNFTQIIENMMAVAKTFLKAVKTGFLNIFPIDRIAAAGRKVLDIFQKFTRAFVLNAKDLDEVGKTLWDTSSIEGITDAIKNLIKFFRGLASAADIAWMAISQPIKAILKRIPFFSDFYNNTNKNLIGIIRKLGQFGDKITVFRDAVKDWEIFGYLMDYFLDNLDELGKKYPVLGAVLYVFNGLKKTIRNLKEYFKELNIKPLSAAFGLFKMVVTSLWNVLNGVFGVLRTAKNSVDWSWLEGPKKIIINTLKALSDYSRGLTNFEQVTKKIGGVLGSFFYTLGNIFNKINVVGKVKTASYEIEKQYSNLNVTIDKTGKKVTSVWEKIKGFFTPVSDFFKSVGNSGEKTFDGIAKRIALIGGGVTAASLSITHLAKSFKKINILNNISDLLNSGIDVLKAYQKQAQSKTILNIAIAVGILAGALLVLSLVPYEKLENGLAIFIAFITTLSMTLTTVINSLTKFNEVLGKSKKQLTQFDVLNNLTTKLGNIGMKLAKGFNKQSLGKMFKDIAISVLILVGALSALVLLFKFDKDNTVKAIHALARIIRVLAVAVGVLVIAMNAFSRTATNFAGTFSQFAKLAGVSGIIVSMSLAVLVLVGAMVALSKIEPDRLSTSFVAIGSLIILIGTMAALITGLSSSISGFDKLKKVSVRITGAIIAVVAIAAAFALLVKYIGQDQSDAWAAALTAIIAVMGVFGIIVATMITAASTVQDAKVFKKLGSLVAVMTTAILAIAAGLYMLSKAGSIPASIVVTIGIISAATVALLVFMATVTAKAKGDFSTNFVKVIEGIAFSISAIVVSFGVLTLAIAALIASISSVDISNNDAEKASGRVVNKIIYIAKVLNDALPKLKKLFYNIGCSVGTVFTSFTTGFVNTVMQAGETYNDVAEKFVNLIVDILGKVVGTLKSRKDDIAKIIGDAVEFLGTEIAAAINAFFSKNGQPVVSSDQVLNWIGIGGVALGLGKLTLTILANFNTIANAVKNFDAAWKVFKGTSVVMKFAAALEKVKWFLVSVWEVQVAAAGSAGWAFAALAGGIAIIITGITALIGFFKRLAGVAKDSYEAPLLSLKGMEQVIVDGWKKVALTIITVFKTVVDVVIGLFSGFAYCVLEIINGIIVGISKVVGFFNKDAGQAMLAWNDKYVGHLTKVVKTATAETFKGIGEDWKNVVNEWGEAFGNSGKEVVNNYVQGEVNALKDGRKELSEEAGKNADAVMKAEKKEYQEASPSKKSYDIYWNYILGAKNALTDGGKELIKVMKTNNNKLIKENITGTKSLEESYKKLGFNTSDDSLKGLSNVSKQGTYDVGYEEHNKDGSVIGHRVQLNKELTDSILAQAEALRGLSKQSALTYIQEQARYNGIKASEQDIYNLTNYLYDAKEDRSTLYWDRIQSLQNATVVAWDTVLSAEEYAAKEAVDKQEEANKLTYQSASELSKKLVGKKKSEAQEILRQELVRKGMSEEQAEEESKKMIALTFANNNGKKKIQESALQDAIKIMKAETDIYEQNLKIQTNALNDAYQKRLKMQGAYDKELERMQQGKGDVSSYLAASKNLKAANSEYDSALAKLNQLVADATKRMGEKGLLNSDQFQKDYEEAYKNANIKKIKKSGSIKDALTKFLKDATGKTAKELDFSSWKVKTHNTDTNINDKDKAIKAAEDTKKKLEKNRADLTPTFDLDKLSDEAKKANGIVTSSLMAAQNASIGDYINKDSELNPFMKDRWQNVYNFTQNNYSPKALSRTDIYRQTQRQLKLSRGF